MRQEWSRSISLAKRFFAFLDLGLTQMNSVFIELGCTIVRQFRGPAMKRGSEDPSYHAASNSSVREERLLALGPTTFSIISLNTM